MLNKFAEKRQMQIASNPRRAGPRPSILDTIGETPVVRVNHIGPSHVDLYAKLEAFNPMGSVKDRLAMAVIEAAEESGELMPGQTVIEATSGNTGIGLAMVCAQMGYPLVIVMAENFSIERRKLLRFLGAKVILTPASERGTGAFEPLSGWLQSMAGSFCRQFENQSNADIHLRTTGQEILNDFLDIGLDYWVTGFGTGGTLNGVARALKLSSPETKIVVAEPENSQILNSGIEQRRRPNGAPARSHPNSRAHPIQGWSPDYIPKLAGDVHDAGLIDIFQPVSGADALQVSHDLARREGILCGPSGGATVAAALELAADLPPGTTILAMIPDTGERYLSTPLFDRIAVDMTEEEREIASSAPTRSNGAVSRSNATSTPISEAARSFVRSATQDRDAPVVMFGFEWCEFCWSVRRLFEDAGIPFKSIDVDSAEFRADDRGGDILRALFEETGMRTVPQVFLAGTLIGGASDVLGAMRDGALARQLKELKPPIHARTVNNPMGYLPNWVRKSSAPKTNRDTAAP